MLHPSILLALIGLTHAQEQRAPVSVDAYESPVAPGCPVPMQLSPVYPPRMDRAHLGGEVVVHAKFDDCGRVVEAKVAQSSLNWELDQAAIDAVSQWVLSAAAVKAIEAKPKDGRKAIGIPVVFAPPNPRTSTSVTKDACRGIRSSGVIPRPMDSQGNLLDGYFVRDPCPIGKKTVADALRFASKNAFFTSTLYKGAPRYMVIDKDGISSWSFTVPGLDWNGIPMHAIAFRERSVNDGEYSYRAVSMVCEASQAACAQAMDYWFFRWNEKNKREVLQKPKASSDP